MTDLDQTEIVPTEQNPIKASLQVLSGIEPDTFQINNDVVIGRSSPSDIILFAPSLSKQHAKITFNNGQYFLTDLESSDKTFQNKIELQPNVSYALSHGDEIKFGDVLCSFQQENSSSLNGTSELSSSVALTTSEPIETDAVKATEIEDTSSTDNNLMIIENPVDEQMDTEQTNESPSMVIDEKQPEDTNEMDEEIAPAPTTSAEAMPVDESVAEVQATTMEAEKSSETVPATDVPMEAPVADETAQGEEEEEEKEEESTGTASGRGVPRMTVGRARGRHGAAASRPRVVSTRLRGTRRQVAVSKVKPKQADTTLEETITTETEESPKKVEVKEEKPTTTTEPNIRVSARIKQRESSGRNRQFPYTDEYVDLDVLEKQPKPTRERASASPQKRVSSLRQQPIDATVKSDENNQANVYEDIDTPAETKQTTRTSSRKRKSTTPATTPEPAKRSRPTTPQTVPKANTRRKQPTTTVEQSPTVKKSNRRATTTAAVQQPTKRARKSAKASIPEQSTDRPVRIALSSHLNFDTNHFETLRQLGFEILDETSPVDALVVDRIRRTKKFFICLARGAHILSPRWIETMIKDNRYVPYEKFYLEDKTAETRYGFQLRESVRLAKQRPIFGNQIFFCTKDTSPPYDDLKDIIEAAGGKLIDKVNPKKLDKDLICIVAQSHKNEYEDLFKKGLAIVSEEFILSGISKQKLDFDTFSLFQVKETNEK